MAELELARLHEDGEHLVLRAPDGTEHALPITEALRAAVRRDRPRTEALQTQAHAPLRPRDLQARLRAGATAEELAMESGLPVAHVQRYEWPVVAEREHVIGQVRGHRIDGDSDTTLGEAADSRLAARGVSSDEASWSARRDGTAPWVVEVRFSAGDRERSARWTFDPRGRVVTSLDDEARWLGQPEDPLSPEMIGVPSIAGRSLPRGESRRAAGDPATDATALLLDDLAGRRGQRPGGRTARRADDAYQADELPLGDLDPAPRPATGAVPRVPRLPETGPQPVARVAAPQAHDANPDDAGSGGPAEAAGASVVELGSRRHRPAAAPEPEVETPVRTRRAETAQSSVDLEPSPRPEPAPEPASVGGAREHTTTAPPAPVPATARTAEPHRAGPARRPARKGRAQVPSWDEIVFGGARPQK